MLLLRTVQAPIDQRVKNGLNLPDAVINFTSTKLSNRPTCVAFAIVGTKKRRARWFRWLLWKNPAFGDIKNIVGLVVLNRPSRATKPGSNEFTNGSVALGQWSSAPDRGSSP